MALSAKTAGATLWEERAATAAAMADKELFAHCSQCAAPSDDKADAEGVIAQDAGATLWEERAATAATVADEAFDASRGQDDVLCID